MYHTWVILKRDLKGSFTSSPDKKVKSLIWATVVTAALLGLVCLYTYGAYRLFNYIKNSLSVLPGLAEAVQANILNGTAVFAMVMLFLTALQATYQLFYESDDLEFLLSQPVPVSSVFAARYVKGYLSLSLVVMAFGLPAWYGYAAANHLGIGFYLWSTIAFLLLLMLGYSIVSVLLLVAMKNLPGRKMKQLFVAFTAILGVLFVLISQILSAKMARTQDPVALLRQIAQSGLTGAWYLPSTWMTNAVLGTLPAFRTNPSPYTAALVLGAVGLTLAAVYASRNLFLAGWASRAEEAAPARRKHHAHAGKVRTTPSFFRGTYWTILRKDITLLLRDPLIWYNIAVSVIVLGFFIYNMTTQSQTETVTEQDSIVVGTLLLTMSSLMGSIAAAQIGGISVSREGPAFWLLRSNPVDPAAVFWSKLTYALLPPATLTILFLVSMEFTSVPRLPLWLGFLLGASMVFSVASLQIFLDTSFPDFAIKMEFGSNKSTRGSAKLLVAMFSSMGIIYGMFAIVAIPSMLCGKQVIKLPAKTVNLISFAAVVSVALLIVTLCLYYGRKRMAKLLTDM